MTALARKISLKPSITIIVIDTLRLDEFKRLATDGQLEGFFITDRCIAPASWTLPSHASMFTGMYPSEHGAHETKTVKSLDIEAIRLKKRTLVSELKDTGYNTYGISANPYVSPVYGFDEFGFFFEESYFTDVFGSAIEVSKRLKPILSKYRNIYGNNVARLSSAIIKDDPKLFLNLVVTALAYSPSAVIKKAKAKMLDGWPIEKGGARTVKRVRDMHLAEPFFLFINLMEAHDPYTAGRSNGSDMKWHTSFLKEPPAKERVEKWKKLYAIAAQRGYRYALDIIRGLRTRFGDNQVIILTSDHGQEFGEHGFIGHGCMLHDEIVRVPLAVLLPKRFSKNANPGYASLVNVRAFIGKVLEGKRDAAAALFSKKVYAENFGTPSDFRMVKGIDAKKVEKVEKYQKRVFG